MIICLNQLRAENGLEAIAYDIARTQVSHGSKGLVQLAFPALEGEPFEVLRNRFLDLYNDRLAVDTRLFDGCEQLLSTLEARGMPWGIVTNKPGFLATPLLRALKLSERAGCIVAGDTLPQRKPHPAPLLHAAELLGVAAPRCLYVGDAERDVQSARSAGMAVLVASYGYLDDEDDTAAWQPDGHIAAPLDILTWLQRS
jgi:phosphoglycolate phosphatase